MKKRLLQKIYTLVLMCITERTESDLMLFKKNNWQGRKKNVNFNLMDLYSCFLNDIHKNNFKITTGSSIVQEKFKLNQRMPTH